MFFLILLVFARQCNPSTTYSMERMRDAIGGSIRQAKHQLLKLQNIELRLSDTNNQHTGDDNTADRIVDNNSYFIDVHTEYRNDTQSRECILNTSDYE